MRLKILPIKRSSDFQLISKIGSKFSTKTLIFICSKRNSINNLPEKSDARYLPNSLRLGITVSKNISKLSVTRNLIKRRLRAAFRILCVNGIIKKDNDYIVIARKEILKSKFAIIIRDLEQCIKNLKKEQSEREKL